MSLELILTLCSEITIIEFLNADTASFDISDADAKTPQASEVMEPLLLLDTQLKAAQSLDQVIVNVKIYQDDKEGVEKDIRKTTDVYGWKVRFIWVESPRHTWLSSDDMVEFHNEEDYLAYEHELLERQERQEEQDWMEEYYSRRADPYWKNDSDYD